MTELCICAAVKLKDGKIFRCHRHHHGLAMAHEREQMGYVSEVAEQGFMTSHNRFVGRVEGRQLQDAAGIESVAPGGYRLDLLFSEDLY